MLAHRPHDPPGLVAFTGLDGSHLGLAVGLLRAEAAGDPGLRRLVPEVATAHEAFVSCLELLLAQAALLSEASSAPYDGGAARLLALAQAEHRPDIAMLLRLVGMGLLRDPGTERLCVRPISAFDLFDVCASLAHLIEADHGIQIVDQVDFYSRHMLTLQQVPVAV